MSDGVVTRFAPSPTGYLHIGHAYSALVAWRAAKDFGGRFLLRIEDIDAERCKPEFEDAILEDLAWLGFDWETPVRRQSDHMDDYAAALATLDREDLTYPCFCSRADIKAEIERMGGAPQGGSTAIYPGTCRTLTADERDRNLAMGREHTIRLRMKNAIAVAGDIGWHDLGRGRICCDPSRHGDVVIARKDTPTSYHLAVTVDDALQGVTLVTRGEDIEEFTGIHRVLQSLLGFPAPRYQHHKLLTDKNGRRYAKRDRSLTIRALRAAGLAPADVRAMAEA